MSDKKVKQPKNGYPIIIHGTAKQKAKLRMLSKKSGKSMAEIVCGFIDRAGGPKKKKAPAPVVTAEQAFAQ